MNNVYMMTDTMIRIYLHMQDLPSGPSLKSDGQMQTTALRRWLVAAHKYAQPQPTMAGMTNTVPEP
jgi:hypothetical protein